MSVPCGTMAGVAYEGLVVRLDPNNSQASYLLGCAGASRKAYNFAVEQQRERSARWREARDAGVQKADLPRPLSARDLQVAWQDEREGIAPWHGQYPSKVYLFALRAAHTAHRRFLSGAAGAPRFKARHREVRFKVTDPLGLTERHLKLPKLGMVKIYRPDQAQARVRRLLRRGKARIVSATLWRTPAGVWHASLTLEVDKAARPAPDAGPWVPVVGVDLGVKTRAVAAAADGGVVAEVAGVALLREHARRLRRTQRALSRKDRVHGARTNAGRPRRSPSRRREKARLRVARVHRDVANARATLTHQLTAQLARLDAHVVVEDLNVRGMTRRGGSRKRGLNRAVHDAALAEIRRQLAYKLPPGRLIVADRWYPSSRLCRQCGVKNHDLTLADRTWTCTGCGTRHDRDVNAAVNLAAWGERHRSGGRTQAGDRDWPGPSGALASHARRAADHPAVSAAGACVETGTQHPHPSTLVLVLVGSVWDGSGNEPAAVESRRARTSSRGAHPR